MKYLFGKNSCRAKRQAAAKSLVFSGLALATILTFSFAFSGCAKIEGLLHGGKTGAHGSEQAALYYCPMHPTYTSPKPGTCPICNMNLVPMEAHDDHSEHEMKPTDAQTVCLLHECPMIKAGETCPMLIVSETGEVPQCPVCQKAIAEDELKPVAAGRPDGYAAVSLSAAKRQLIGIRTAPVAKRTLKSTLRTAGLMLRSAELNFFVYESDLPKMAEGNKMTAFFPAIGKEFTGTVSRIPLSLDRGLSPSTIGAGGVLSAGSSQLTVRARMDDPANLLRRGMTADVEIYNEAGNAAAVPEAAVFFTGRRAIVFVEKSEGLYEPREVTLGTRADGYYAVESGVDVGETVVTSGNFLIDSESRLQASFQGSAGTKPSAASKKENPTHAH
jgi:Cu(I)/Ag(I) efflux system membrane fusion protein